MAKKIKCNLKPLELDTFRHCLEHFKESTTVCHNCGKVVTITNHPYARDVENDKILFVGICPESGEICITHS